MMSPHLASTLNQAQIMPRLGKGEWLSRAIDPLEFEVVPELLHWDAEDLHALQVGHEVELLVVAEQHLYCLLSG